MSIFATPTASTYAARMMHTYSTHILLIHFFVFKGPLLSAASLLAAMPRRLCPPVAQLADGCNADVDAASSAVQPDATPGQKQTVASKLHSLLRINSLLQRLMLFGSPAQMMRAVLHSLLQI